MVFGFYDCKYLFCGHPFRFRGLRPGDKVQMTLDGKTMLDFRIK